MLNILEARDTHLQLDSRKQPNKAYIAIAIVSLYAVYAYVVLYCMWHGIEYLIRMNALCAA